MASLKSLLGSKNFTTDEVNLEQGRIWSYNNGTMYSRLCNGFCWRAPGGGEATIEMWGAGGSGARMSCCGGGIPGNAAGYSRRTISVASDCKICGSTGKSCGNASSLCFRGCGESTGLCWFSTSGNGCMCAQGGRGGISMCSTSPSLYCCYRAQGYCTTNRGPNCGLVCNRLVHGEHVDTVAPPIVAVVFCASRCYPNVHVCTNIGTSKHYCTVRNYCNICN